MRIGKTMILIAGLAAMLLSGCQRNIEPISKSGFMLNTFVTVTIYDKDDPKILEGCLELCRSYENIFSKTLEGSEVYKLNHRSSDQQTVTVSDDVKALISEAQIYSERSNGGFDVTIEPLSSLWNFTAESPVIPSEKDIKEAVLKVNYKNLKLEGNDLTFLSPDTTIDFGGVAKGYIADRLKDYLLEQGVKSAIINLGGNVLCVGEKPDGTPFKIGLQKPFADRSETIETLNIKDMSVVSSGVYERHFIKDGVNYHHLLNPRDGYPFQNGLISVTILSDISADGDGMTTACFSLGLDEGLKLVNSLDGIYGIFITDDYEVYYSDGAEKFLEVNP
ncbi:FAD:protein FMN transferase [Lacrimispora sp.]|uniref:FAD:protein FMN transferase n=1 Tax=Lacrimispora sp. TaxID=2719234 RepID=UPI003995BB0D